MGAEPPRGIARRVLLVLATAAFLASAGVASASRPPNTAVGGGYAKVTVGPITVKRTTAHLALTCSGTPGATCFVLIGMVVRETLRGNKVIAVSASKRHTRTRLEAVGGTTESLGVGRSDMVPLPLYANGKRLLAHHHPLAVRLTVENIHFERIATATVTFGT